MNEGLSQEDIERKVGRLVVANWLLEKELERVRQDRDEWRTQMERLHPKPSEPPQ